MLKEQKECGICEDPIKMIAEDWLLLAAGNREKYNMMTASWGTVGHLWNRDVCTVFIRPQRYTYAFFEDQPFFSVSVLPSTCREIMKFCGKRSGRDVDKMHLDGLTPVFADGTVYFEEARRVFLCKKIYVQDLQASGFCDPSFLTQYYPANDLHRMYVGEIIRTLSE